MKLTLLEIVQDILNDLNSDSVNSINDTEESLQAAQIVKTTYLEMMADRDWPHLRSLIQLNAVSDTARPTYLQLPVNVRRLDIIKYNKRKSTDTKDKFEDVKYQEPDSFLRLVNSRDESQATIVEATDSSGVKIKVYNDRAPQYWTSFDDEYIVMDAYDSAVDSTLQASKTQCVAYVDPSWSNLDTAIPDLPSEAFPSLLAEAKSTAFVMLKEVANEKAEQKSRRQRQWLSRNSWRAKGGIRTPDYGRKARFSYRSSLFNKD